MYYKNPRKYFLPRKWELITDQTNFHGWDFLRELIGHNVFLASIDWHNHAQRDLPVEYPYYFVKTEGANVAWVERQAQRVQGTIFWMCQYRDYGAFDHLPNVVSLPGIEWHYEFAGCQQDFNCQVDKHIKYKLSCLVNRQTENKILSLAAVYQHIGFDSCMVSLHNNIEEKNVNHWQIDHPVLNKYIQVYHEHLRNCSIEIADDIDLRLDSYNFQHPAFTNAAMNINNESFHYSLQHKRINPGPVLTEKTIKAIMGECAFLNNGQFDTYNSLTELGFRFDYGLDLGYDQISADYDRMLGMIQVIKQISSISAYQLWEQTRDSCLHNKDHVMSGAFYQQAEAVNHRSLERILEIIQ